MQRHPSIARWVIGTVSRAGSWLMADVRRSPARRRRGRSPALAVCALLVTTITGPSTQEKAGTQQRLVTGENRLSQLALACAASDRAACQALVAPDSVDEALRLAEVGPATLLHGLADAASAAGRFAPEWQLAIGFLRMGAQRFPHDATFHYQLGMAVLGSGVTSAPSDAEAYGPLLRAVQEKPDFTDALVQLGSVQLHLDQPESAEKSLRAALRITHGLVYARLLLGDSLLLLRRPLEAAAEFREALRLAGEDRYDRASAQLGVAEASFWLGDGKSAIDVLRQADNRVGGVGAGIDCAIAMTLWWLGQDDESRQTCQGAVADRLYCPCQGRASIERAQPDTELTQDQSAVVTAALLQGPDLRRAPGDTVVVEATTAFSEIDLPPIAGIRGPFQVARYLYADGLAVAEAVEDLLARSVRPARVELAPNAGPLVRRLTREEMREMVSGRAPSFYQAFPSARGFVTASQPGFSKDGRVAAVAVQRNDSLGNAPVWLLVLDRAGDSWKLRRDAVVR